MPAFLPGQVIAHYRIIGTLGEGGMGCVYEAFDARLNRQVAIKVLLPQFSPQQAVVRRFFDEALATAQIGHPGIVQVYDVGQQVDGSNYLVMELLRGETLGRRLARNPFVSFPIGQKLRLGWQVATALAAAHDKGIVHRDVKPDNIMLVRDPDAPETERAKVLDFGIAKLTRDYRMTRTGYIMGTPAYMAPEQARDSGSVSDRADVYALGVVLFEMLAGRPLFESDGDVMAVLARKFFQPPPKLAEVAPRLPEELISLVDSMLALEPQDRPAMRQVASTLRRLSERERQAPHERSEVDRALLPAGGGTSNSVRWRRQIVLGAFAIVINGLYFSLFAKLEGGIGVKLSVATIFALASWGTANIAVALAQGGISLLRSLVHRFEKRPANEALNPEPEPSEFLAPGGLPSLPSIPGHVAGSANGDSRYSLALPPPQESAVSAPNSLLGLGNSLLGLPDLSQSLRSQPPSTPNQSSSPPNSSPSLPSLPPLPELAIGDRVQQFELVELIEDIDINKVFLARSDIHYKVAIHVLKRRYDGSLDHDAAKRFLNGARALEVLNKIEHQNLPRFISVDQRPDGTPFLITEFYAGETLRERLERGADFPQSEIIDVALQLAHALYICHEQGVVHRALTPDAVLFRKHLGTVQALPAAQQVKLLGFSMVKLLEGHHIPKAEDVHTQHGQRVGVKLYMAPEQAAAEPGIDGRADVFVLGMLLFEMLTGQPACVAPRGARAVSIYATRDEFPLFADPVGPLQDVIRQMTKRNPISRLNMKEVYERLLAIRSAASSPDGFPSVSLGNMSLIGLSRKFRVQLPSSVTPEIPNQSEAPPNGATTPSETVVATHVALPSLETPAVAPPVTSRPEDVTLAEALSRHQIRDNLLKMPDGEFDSFYLIWFPETQKLVGSLPDKNSRINHLLQRHEPSEILERLHRFRNGGRKVG